MKIVKSEKDKEKYIELLSPARDLATATAAIDFGADAVYMGAAKYGARYAAGNSIEDIAKAVDYARKYGVRVYATLNTLLFDNELDDARATALRLVEAGVDALIIQDTAYLEMGIKGVEFHASTQFYNADPEKIIFLRHCGVSRAILERGLTLQQIRAITEKTDMEIEAFVHGAICVCNSGRCYMSRSMGPRSGNRGECSQPCRLTYDLLDNNMQPLMTNKYLLSVKDLDLSERIGDMLDAGVTSFKIEGRLKDISYVKNCVNYYRRRIDEELSSRPGLRRSSEGVSVADISPDLSKSFTRGRSEYFFDGLRSGVASFDTPKALGEPIGNIESFGKGWIGIKTDKVISPQDGLCFMSNGQLEGTKVNSVDGGRLFLDKEYAVLKGETVYRNFDYKFDKSLSGSRTKRVIDVTASISMTPQAISLTYCDISGHSAVRSVAGVFDEARNPEKMVETIKEQVAKSGDTIFRVSEMEIVPDNEVRFVPVSLLASLRRDALDDLLRQRISSPPVRRIPKIVDSHCPYGPEVIGSDENVTNRLARQFYHKHGVKDISDGLDLSANMRGERVMRMPYCIRREIGECLLEGSRLKGDLYLRRGTFTYALKFDCAKCEMSIYSL